jgi:hypothetical protein
MDFAYITFVNNNENYINLMKSTIKSVKVFSQYPLIVYCVDIPPETNPFIATEKCILRNISMTDIHDQNIYYMKPYVIVDAIKRGLQKGYYIEADDLLTPNADSIKPLADNLDKYPISPIHPDDVAISPEFMAKINVQQKTQHYIHGHVLFKDTNLPFLQEWLDNCFLSVGEHWDESVLNCMYWKYGLTNHYLPIIDPWYQTFYQDPGCMNKVVSLHGCKNPEEHAAVLQQMLALFYRENKVSVIIPTYNRFKYLMNTIASIKAQTYPALEIIVVNDASTQREYYDYTWPADIKIIHLATNSKTLLGYASCGHVRNQGIPVATGKYIAFCDDDDTWFSNKLELQIKAMRADGCQMSSTDGLVGHGVFDPVILNKKYSDLFTQVKLPELWDLALMQSTNYMLCSSVMLEKTLLDKINNFRPLKSSVEDHDCWLRALQHTKSAYVNVPCVYYDMNHGDGRHYEL